jgi:asparagine synthase (glutamine-hydrolysing)
MRHGRGKDILIRALGERLPPELLNRPKQGFGVPLDSWMRGPLRDFLHDHLLSPEFLSRGIVSPERLRLTIQEHDSGRRNNCGILWMLIVLALWLRPRQRSAPPVSNPCITLKS